MVEERLFFELKEGSCQHLYLTLFVANVLSSFLTLLRLSHVHAVLT